MKGKIMRMNLVLELLDVPGQLFNALKPIASAGANIVTIIHEREKSARGKKVPVSITIEGDKKTLDLALEGLKAAGIPIVKIDGVTQKEDTTLIFIGKNMDQKIQEILNKVDSITETRIVDLSFKISHKPGTAAAKLVIETPKNKKESVIGEVKKLASKRNILVICEAG